MRSRPRLAGHPMAMGHGGFVSSFAPEVDPLFLASAGLQIGMTGSQQSQKRQLAMNVDEPRMERSSDIIKAPRYDKH